MVEDDQKTLAQGPLKIFETIKDAQGVSRKFETVKFPISIAGRPLLLGGISIEITERMRAEEEISAANKFIGEVISGASEGVIVYDREFRLRLWNPYMERLTGMLVGEVLGKIAFDLFPHLVEQGVDQLLKRALKGESVESGDIHYQDYRIS